MSTTANSNIDRQSPLPVTQDFPIVGVGASAGGLDAFRKFIENISEDSGMAYVLVQHLAPKYESLLPEILSKSTALPVHEITDDINLAPNNIYIIPENKILKTFDGKLKLEPRDLAAKKNMPIDVFFRSLADVHKSFAIGTVLSGSGYDGTEGLKSIKEQGGVTYAQIPETAAFDSMPQSAINAGAVDFLLAPEDIPQHLLHIKKAYKTNHAYADDAELEQDEEDVIRQILRLLRLRTGNDFTHYKQPTLRRRIARRMVATKNEEPAAYLKFLRDNKDEQDTLFNDVLIPVSYFFRDFKTFEALCEAVFPLILKNKKSNESIRLWIAGCSTGEEAYSLAICLHEHLAEKAPGIKVQIFATDMSENVITKARAAVYGKQEVSNISEARLQQYFTKTDGHYQISKVIRDMCVFAVHNFLKDPPFAKMDLISCRNVMIYFDQFLQKKALTTFHYALKENAFLFLGKSETPGSVSTLFEPLLKNHKIFTRKSVPGRFLPSSYDPVEVLPLVKSYTGLKKNPAEPDFHQLAFDIIFSKYTPAGVVVNSNKEIVHFHGDTGPFLVSSPGKPNFNVLKMAREGLAFELRNALLKSETVSATIASEKISLKGENYLVSFEIIPLQKDTAHKLVLFYKSEISAVEQLQIDAINENGKERIKQLEAELEQMRDDIRRVTEDQEAANEELQSANEELLSSSEELQSLNEELETSAEELQSNNEELISVNDELMDRQEQLVNSRIYAEAIVETIGEPLVILDKDLRIKSANGAFYKYFETTEFDTEGRLIYELGTGQWNNATLRTLLENVLPKKTIVTDFELTALFPKIGERSMMLNARQVINGKYSEALIMMAFSDITELKMTKILKESEERFRIMADTAPVVLWVANTECQWLFFNKSWLDFRGRTMEQEIGEGWKDGIHPDDRENFESVFNTSCSRIKEFYIEFRLQKRDGNYRWIGYRGVPRIGANGEFQGFIGGAMDIDEQKNFSTSMESKVVQRTKELKESESFLQSILNTTQNLIYVYDFEKQKVVFINDRSLAATGHNPKDIINSKTDIFSSLVHNDDLGVFEKQRRDIQESNSDNNMDTVEFRLWNGKEWAYYLSRDLILKRDDDGKVLQYLGVATDVSEIRNINEELVVKNRELIASNTELNSFSSIASHDLKEPLRKIMVFTKLISDMEKDKVSETSAKYMERVILSADRMQQLIDDLISYSRTSTEKIKMTKTDLNKTLKIVLEELKEVIQESGATIESEELPVLPIIPSQFLQLFQNLINNAIKYAKKDEAPQVKILLHKATREELIDLKVNPETGYYKITFKDNGIGFAKAFEKVIFEPFKRLHGKDEYTGTGIGLAICKKIMDNHKGFIVAESEPGEGTAFCIYVPDGIKKTYP